MDALLSLSALIIKCAAFPVDPNIIESLIHTTSNNQALYYEDGQRSRVFLSLDKATRHINQPHDNQNKIIRVGLMGYPISLGQVSIDLFDRCYNIQQGTKKLKELESDYKKTYQNKDLPIPTQKHFTTWGAIGLYGGLDDNTLNRSFTGAVMEMHMKYTLRGLNSLKNYGAELDQSLRPLQSPPSTNNPTHHSSDLFFQANPFGLTNKQPKTSGAIKTDTQLTTSTTTKPEVTPNNMTNDPPKTQLNTHTSGNIRAKPSPKKET
jgi:hypothetical protein